MQALIEVMQLDTFFERFDALIQSPKRFVLACHVNPDGDAIGSVLAMSEFLHGFGHEVKMVVANDFPDFLHWMPGAEKFLVFEKDAEACKELLVQYQLLSYNIEIPFQTLKLSYICFLSSSTFLSLQIF